MQKIIYNMKAKGGVTLAKNQLDISVKVYRYEPNKETQGHFQDFRIKSMEPMSIMALLAKIHEIDSSFACRTSTCFKGQCGSCLIRVNGQDVFGCTTLVKPGESIIVEPYSKFKVIRDVVVDFDEPLYGGKG